MTSKFLSSITASGIAYLILQSQLQSNDALFLVTSANYFINLGLLILAGAAVYLSFIKRFKYRQTYVATVVAAIGLSIIGFAGFAYSGVSYHFGTIKPLDYVILMQLGVVYSIYALTYRHQPVNWSPVWISRYYAIIKQAWSRPLPKPAIAISQTRKPRHA